MSDTCVYSTWCVMRISHARCRLHACKGRFHYVLLLSCALQELHCLLSSSTAATQWGPPIRSRRNAVPRARCREHALQTTSPPVIDGVNNWGKRGGKKKTYEVTKRKSGCQTIHREIERDRACSYIRTRARDSWTTRWACYGSRVLLALP